MKAVPRTRYPAGGGCSASAPSATAYLFQHVQRLAATVSIRATASPSARRVILGAIRSRRVMSGFSFWPTPYRVDEAIDQRRRDPATSLCRLDRRLDAADRVSTPPTPSRLQKPLFSNHTPHGRPASSAAPAAQDDRRGRSLERRQGVLHRDYQLVQQNDLTLLGAILHTADPRLPLPPAAGRHGPEAQYEADANGRYVATTLAPPRSPRRRRC